MKIRRLSLHAWRGVSARDITLSDGVTLIEGANEIGKSTLVEALRMLFREQDSSKKKDVKAIQPVGEDVGSSVEAQIECGDVHFTYRKTYNRRPGTELHIHAPRTEHLTGGDAHNRARAILDAHMDVGLWDTLLVEQGHALGAINLADSNGLARALDVASGGQGSDGDGSQLLEAARAEYERYYTLKAGKEKFSEQIEAVDKLTLEVTDLERALQALDDDLRRAEKLEEDLQRLQQRLPELQANARELGERWSAIAGLEDDIAQMQAARAPLAALRDSARENNHSRQQKVQNSQHIDAQIIELSHRIEPEAAALQTSQSVLDDMLAELSRLRQQRRQQQERERQAQADLRYLADSDMLREIEQRLQRLSAYNERATALRLQLDAISINAQARRDIETAHSELALARALQESSATRMELACDRELPLTIDGAPQTLAAGQSLQRYLTQPLCVELPGGVVIRLTPGSGEEDPETRVKAAQSTLQALLAQYHVADFADAIASDERRQALQSDLAQVQARIGDQLSAEFNTQEDLASRARQLQTAQAHYLDQHGRQDLPVDKVATERRRARVESDIAQTDSEIDALESALARQREAHEAKASAHRQLAQELMALRAQQAQLEASLKEERERESDDRLQALADARAAELAAADEALAELQERLQAQDPDTVRALLENAEQASARASEDLVDMRQQHAVVASRLQLARASGQREALDEATRRLDAAQDRLAATRRRAAAAKLLWERLNHFREATQKAYVRPLQAQIERLGRFVFGQDFHLTLGDDWTIVECSRSGKTLRFQDLSIGAQEQLGILTRLAAAQIVATHGGVPIIIDDALGFSDPERLRGMGTAIAAAGRDSQVILLSCTPDRFRYVGSASVIRL